MNNIAMYLGYCLIILTALGVVLAFIEFVKDVYTYVYFRTTDNRNRLIEIQIKLEKRLREMGAIRE